MKNLIWIAVLILALILLTRKNERISNNSEKLLNEDIAECTLNLNGTPTLIQILLDGSGSNLNNHDHSPDIEELLSKLIEIGVCNDSEFVIEVYDHSRNSSTAILRVESKKPLPSIYSFQEYKMTEDYNKAVVAQNNSRIDQFLLKIDEQRRNADPTRSYLNIKIAAMSSSARLSQYSNFHRISFLITDLIDDPFDKGGNAVDTNLIQELSQFSRIMLCYPTAESQIKSSYPQIQLVPSGEHFVHELLSELEI